MGIKSRSKGRFFTYASCMQMQCKCIANAKLVHTVCSANAMQNYANKNCKLYANAMQVHSKCKARAYGLLCKCNAKLCK
nr:MAG TPA: hypothetical protein [Caudoviricetes sp.]